MTEGDRNLIKHHSFSAAHRCPRFRWHVLIWIIHWGGIVTSFQATAVSAICWAVQALGGSDRALVWRGNPYFECPLAGNLNEFKLHLSVSRACVYKFYFSASRPPLFVILSLTQMASEVQCVQWSTMCTVIHTNFTVWLRTRTEIRSSYFLANYKMSGCFIFEKYSYIYFIT